MTRFQDAWQTHQQQRFMRPDAARYVRPDASRYLRSDAFRWLPPKLSNGADKPEQKYSPNQPRIPRGNFGAGRWTDGQGIGGHETPSPDISIPFLGEEGEGELFAFDQYAQYDAPIYDVDGSPYYKPGGHHEMTKETFGKWNLPDETRRIFQQSTTGKLPDIIIRQSPEGLPISNAWKEPHINYNRAIGELSEQFLQKSGIRPEQMTPAQAQQLLKEIRESTDPRIRDFNSTLRILQRVFRLRTGRGLE